MIGIIDYGLGNIKAFETVYKKLNIPVQIADNKKKLLSSKKLILPGVGSFDTAMKLLSNSGLKNIISEMVLEKKIPILGICVGMQIMTIESEEGKSKGLGWINSKVKKFRKQDSEKYLPIPHMGWNEIEIKNKKGLFKNIANPKYYFLHSYYVELKDSSDLLCSTNYLVKFASGFSNKNIYGVQFHPEKSHDNGEALLNNFAKIENA